MKQHTRGPLAALIVAVALVTGACSASSDSEEAAEPTTTLSRAELNELDRKETLAEWSRNNGTDVIDFIVRAQSVEDYADHTGMGIGEQCNEALYSTEATGAVTLDVVPDGELQAHMAEAVADTRDALEDCAESPRPDIAVGTVDARADVLLKVMREINVVAEVNKKE